MHKIIRKNLVVSYFTIILVSIFTTHFLLSTRHTHFADASNYMGIFLDSFLMTGIVFPILYYFFLRPLTLEIKVRRKTQIELEQAKEKAEEMNRLKDNFLANMSHEFRTPMNAILGFSDLIMEELRNSDQKELFEFSKSLNNGGRRLLNLLNDVLDISQIEANKMFLNVETGFFVNAVEPVMSVLSILAKEKNLEMTTVINSKRKVYFDAQRFGQVLINIVGNAIRFTEKGKITIEVDEGTNEKNEPCGIVRVIDTGKGISKEFLPHVFDEFRQESEGYSRSHEGSGLGLTISKRLLNLMNGDIKVESEQGVGTTVTLFVPLAE